MPWFITAIMGKEAVEKQAQRLNIKTWFVNRMRTFGFYNTHQEAYNAIKENRGNLSENIFDYIILEYIEEGIHPTVHAVDWWKWDNEGNKWVYLDNDRWPIDLRHVCNWALG